MNRLQSELQRLYLLPPAAAGDAASPSETSAAGAVRAMVLELAGPADWALLSQVWRGVQADLDLPAPAVAVSGGDGLQLWFSLQQAVDAAQAAAFLALLRARYLAGVAPARLRCMPSATEPQQQAQQAWQAPPVPAQQPATGNWSAFIAPGLAPVFADAPWLDTPPGVDGQADVLAPLQSIKPAAFDAALQSLRPAEPAVAPAPPPQQPRAAADAAGQAPDVDPRRFLQRVLNDETVPLALRIEAAKALLREP
jgi:hypothetical protein